MDWKVDIPLICELNSNYSNFKRYTNEHSSTVNFQVKDIKWFVDYSNPEIQADATSFGL